MVDHTDVSLRMGLIWLQRAPSLLGRSFGCEPRLNPNSPRTEINWNDPKGKLLGREFLLGDDGSGLPGRRDPRDLPGYRKP
jgi:hypothetical protein